MRQDTDILIVGTGQAGVQTACDLRRRGFAGTILMVGEEPDEPYERPPLSKAYLAGHVAPERLRLQPSSFWREARIERLSGVRVTSVDPQLRIARTNDGLSLAYGKLVWAAGGGARRLDLPGGELRGVHTIRTRADADRVREALAASRDVVIVGGGYIGLETAASIRGLNKRVTVIEALERVLSRAVAPAMSQALETAHRTAGVSILTSTGVAALGGRDGQVTHVELTDGRRLAADLVIVGVGLTPHEDVLAKAGAVIGDGVHVDPQCQTSLAHVFAVGDCARQPRPSADGRSLRLESVANAIDHGAAAAAAIVGDLFEAPAIPWFWSDQYDLRLQTAGLNGGHDEVVLRGDPATGRFSVIYLQGGRVIALDCLNASQDFLAGKRLIAQKARPDRSALADPRTPLKSLLQAAAGAMSRAG